MVAERSFGIGFGVWGKEGWEDPVIEERYGEVVRTDKAVLSFNTKKRQQLQEIQNKMRAGKEYKLKEMR